MRTRIAIVGGGASGMMAAIAAAEHGAEVWIYECKDRLGKKILATGNGRCNLTNEAMGEEFFYSSSPEHIKEALSVFTNIDKSLLM